MSCNNWLQIQSRSIKCYTTVCIVIILDTIMVTPHSPFLTLRCNCNIESLAGHTSCSVSVILTLHVTLFLCWVESKTPWYFKKPATLAVFVTTWPFLCNIAIDSSSKYFWFLTVTQIWCSFLCQYIQLYQSWCLVLPNHHSPKDLWRNSFKSKWRILLHHYKRHHQSIELTWTKTHFVHWVYKRFSFFSFLNKISQMMQITSLLRSLKTSLQLQFTSVADACISYANLRINACNSIVASKRVNVGVPWYWRSTNWQGKTR